jgi:hypothetical protein
MVGRLLALMEEYLRVLLQMMLQIPLQRPPTIETLGFVLKFTEDRIKIPLSFRQHPAAVSNVCPSSLAKEQQSPSTTSCLRAQYFLFEKGMVILLFSLHFLCLFVFLE